MPAPLLDRDHPALAVVVLCFGGLTAALTQTLVIPIQSELPQLLSTSAANASWVVTVTLLDRLQKIAGHAITVLPSL